MTNLPATETDVARPAQDRLTGGSLPVFALGLVGAAALTLRVDPEWRVTAVLLGVLFVGLGLVFGRLGVRHVRMEVVGDRLSYHGLFRSKLLVEGVGKGRVVEVTHKPTRQRMELWIGEKTQTLKIEIWVAEDLQRLAARMGMERIVEPEMLSTKQIEAKYPGSYHWILARPLLGTATVLFLILTPLIILDMYFG